MSFGGGERDYWERIGNCVKRYLVFFKEKKTPGKSKLHYEKKRGMR